MTRATFPPRGGSSQRHAPRLRPAVEDLSLVRRRQPVGEAADLHGPVVAVELDRQQPRHVLAAAVPERKRENPCTYSLAEH